MSDLYFCPTAREVESATGGGFDTCCDHPELHVPMPDNDATAAMSQALSEAKREQFRARETGRRLNHRAQQAESKVATFERAVGEWQIGADRGTYVPLRSLSAIAKAVGREIPDRWQLHYQRVEQLEAQVAAVRAYADSLYSADRKIDACGVREKLYELLPMAPAVLAGPEDVPVPTDRELSESLGFAMAAMQPGAEPVFCHHEQAQNSSYETHQAGWGRKTVRTIFCPACDARAESSEGEPVLAPTVLNAERCTQACTERHTNGPGCLMAPDWSKPVVRRKP